MELSNLAACPPDGGETSLDHPLTGRIADAKSHESARSARTSLRLMPTE
jgi:hypothetical protein